MRIALRTTLAAAIASWTIGAIAADPAAKPAAEPPQVQVEVVLAEFDEVDRAEIDRAIGRQPGIHDGQVQAVDCKQIRSLEERKLLRVIATPKIRMASGSTASVSFEHGEGLDRQNKVKPVHIEIEVEAIPNFKAEEQPTIAGVVRYSETTGNDNWRRLKGIDTGVESKAGETCALHFKPRSQAPAKAGQPAKSLIKMLFVTTTIVEPKDKGKVYPNPQVGLQALSPAQQKR